MRGLFFGRWQFIAIAVCAIALCILPFVPGINGPFQLDDDVNLESIHVGDVSTRAIYGAAFNNDSGLLGRPLSNLSFIANQLIGGYDPFGYKLVNVVLHFVNGLLIFALARCLIPLLLPTISETRRKWVSLGAAAIWTIHPLQVSSVLYVVQRMTELAALFMALAIVVALRSLAKPAKLPRPIDGVRNAFGVGMLSLLAVLCKENGALVPFLLLAIGIALPVSTWRLVTDSRGKKVFWILAVAIPVACAMFVTALSFGWIQRAYEGRDFSLSQRLLTQPLVLGGHLKSFLLPDLRTMGLFLDGTPARGHGDPVAWLGVGLFVSSVIGAWLLRRKFPVFAFAVFWFVAAHLLESTILPLEMAFEHRNYLALFGPCLFLAACVARIGDVARRGTAFLIAGALLLTYGGLTFMRSATWSNQTRFIESELRHHPESVRAQTEAAVLASMRGDNQSAIDLIRAAQVAHPAMFFPAAMDMDLGCAVSGYPVDWVRIQRNISENPLEANITSIHKAVALKILGDECIGDIAVPFEEHLDRVIEIYQQARMPHQVQFFLMIKADLQDSPTQTRRILEEAVESAPGNDAALYRLAYFDLNAGNLDDAEKEVLRLRSRTPDWRPAAYRVDELERFLRQARAAESSGRQVDY